MINRLIVGLVPTLQKGKYVEGKGQVRILYSYTENTIVSMTLDDYKMIDMYYKDTLPELGSELLAVLKTCANTTSTTLCIRYLGRMP